MMGTLGNVEVTLKDIRYHYKKMQGMSSNVKKTLIDVKKKFPEQ
jgi:hypothetical protein